MQCRLRLCTLRPSKSWPELLARAASRSWIRHRCRMGWTRRRAALQLKAWRPAGQMHGCSYIHNTPLACARSTTTKSGAMHTRHDRRSNIGVQAQSAAALIDVDEGAHVEGLLFTIF